jgi:aryl-alcohol dehydrogenase-like predicted oxidoreductase
MNIEQMSEEKFQRLGKEVIDLLQVKRNKGSGRVDTTFGSKTETGIGRIVLRILQEVQSGVETPEQPGATE